MNMLNKHLIKIILDYLYPYYKSDIQNYNLFLNYCLNINHAFFSNECLIFNKLSIILEKYKKFNLNTNIIGAEQLLDMLYTGYDNIWLPISKQSTFSTYNKHIEDDIKFLIFNNPLVLNIKHEIIEYRRKDVPIIFAACINKNIPLNIVELLIQQGANPYVQYLGKGSYRTPLPKYYLTTIIDDIYYFLGMPRYTDIFSLLNSHKN